MGVELSSGPGWQRGKIRVKVYRGKPDSTADELHLLTLVLAGALIGAAAMTVVLVLCG